MAIKKTSVEIPLSGRVPGRASGPSRSSGRRRRRIAMCSRKVIGYLGFFRRGVFIGEGASSGVGRGAVTHRGARPGARPRRPVVWDPRGPTPSPLQFSGSFGEFLDVRLLFRPIPRIFPV
jgi:hypothetical protein